MPVAGTFPEAGFRVALELSALDARAACYAGEAFTPAARYRVRLVVEVDTGKANVDLVPAASRDPGGEIPELDAGDVTFLKSLGTQLWRQAVRTPPEQGGGAWSRRVQRWRGPK
ncbi:MAG: hypothetical protein HYV09_36575 [Deltaproteobacteria bacterium]|nr:hypothetical protein [Deltaproteobacteria bacterium]